MTEGSRKTVLVLLLAVIFFFGAVAGVAADRLLLLPPPPRPPGGPGPEQVIGSYVRTLGLDAKQTEQLRGVLADGRREGRAIFLRVQPELERSFASLRQRIRGLLRGDQIARFDRLVEEWERLRSRHEPPSPGTPPPPGAPPPGAPPPGAPPPGAPPPGGPGAPPFP